MINIADDLNRVGDEDHRPHDAAERRMERAEALADEKRDALYEGEMLLDSAAIIELERDRVRRIKASNEAMQAMLPYTRAQMAKPTIADCMHEMMDFSERFFAATDAMFAPLHNKGD